MLRHFGENLGLKLFALATSVMIWFYVAAERNPIITRTVNAEPRMGGIAPPDVIIRLRSETVPVEITGPNNEVETVGENDVKAIVSVRNARPGVSQLRIMRYESPPSAPHITFRALRQYVAADVLAKERKQLRIEPRFTNEAPFGRSYGKARLDPEWAWVIGTKDDLLRVSRLVVYIDTRGGSVRADLPIQAVDRDDVVVDTVTIDPEKTHVELNLVEAPATRTLLVSVPFRGKTRYPYEVTDVEVDPAQVTVSGKSDRLLQMTSVSTTPVSIDGLTADTTREVPLELPPDVNVKDGHYTVRVTIRVKDVSKGGV
jgi:YbbR domain-containing protein